MYRRVLIAGAILFTAFPAAAQRPAREAPPEAFARAMQCRTITDNQERLACYDREVAALEQAEQTSQIRVVDRGQMRRTRTTLFGLDLPDLDIFCGDRGEITEITGTIATASRNGAGKWLFTLEDGGRWLQTDSLNITPDPRPGHSIRIRRASLGSFLANANGRRAVRVRRQN